jgi:hypothetical protein
MGTFMHRAEGTGSRLLRHLPERKLHLCGKDIKKESAIDQ